MKLQNIGWSSVCCTNLSGAKYAEVLAGSWWVRIIKPLVGGYLVTVYGPDKLLREAEAEMSEEEAEATLARVSAL
jgi:hypothetical protein